jgi:hypothetical protein
VFVRAPSTAAPARVALRSDEARRDDDTAPVPVDRATFEQLTEDEQRLVEQLRARDQEVRQHEAAHQAAGGALAGPASFTYQQGPDQKAYAVGGEVPIALREGRTPDETISNARRVRAAALAPAQPSGQDLQVAASASQLELLAAQEKRQLAELERRAEVRGTHLHASEPCQTCARDSGLYRSKQ